MLVSNGLLVHRFEEVVHEGMRLGRHMALDGRSLAYTAEANAELMGKTPKPSEWPSPLPVLTQTISACTGNAGSDGLASACKNVLSSIQLVGLRLFLHQPGDVNGEAAAWDEDFAVQLYSEATADDGIGGTTFPPIDRGSTGLGVCRALKAAGLIAGYRWAVSLRGMAALLQTGGVMIGMPWLASMDDPTADGFIDPPGWEKAPIRGGHEIFLEALESWDEHNPAASVVRFKNSWGSGWGSQGYGRFHLSVYETLKQQIDVKQLVPKAA